MRRDTLNRFGMLLVYGLALLLFVLFNCCLLTGCGMLGLGADPVPPAAERLVEDVDDALADGTVDPAEAQRLDKSAGRVADALEEKRQSQMKMPPTGIPWLDLALGVGGMLLTGAGTHKAVNWSRDRKRKLRGEPTEAKPA